mgnify:CR=1 FL=1|jgi:hypothetical protein
MKKGVEYFPAMFRAEKMDKTRVINKNKDLEEKVEVIFLKTLLIPRNLL